MQVQILGLRHYVDKISGKERLAERFFNNKWRADSVSHLFSNMKSIVEQIPESERYNLYYTAAQCAETRGRELLRQDIIPFDIDGILEGSEPLVTKVVCKILGVSVDDVGVVYSGNGIQVIAGIPEPIEDVDFFDEFRPYYKAVCAQINWELKVQGLDGEADTTVFSAARLLRLPFTENRKKDKGIKKARLIKTNINHVFDLIKASGIPLVSQAEQVSERVLQRIPPDAKGVQEGCLFLKWAKHNQEEVSEPQWYAMLSIIGRLPNGHKLAHEYSSNYSGYDEYLTDIKLKQAMEASGPRTCSNVDTLWSGCQKCENWGKCKSPITLQSKSFIRTQATGFYNVSAEGKLGKPNYDDLMKYFQSLHPFVATEESGMLYTYNGTFWTPCHKIPVHNFAEQNFKPSPSNTMCIEFEKKLRRNNPVSETYFNKPNLVNFSNGTLELEDMTFRLHDKEDGFKFCLPFPYDPDATCPRFDKFMKEVTMGDSQLEAVLLEYMGYTLCGVDPNIGQKALILVGEGANGKSVLIDLLKHLAGDVAYSTLLMGREISKMENRSQLDGKLFNVSEEVPTTAMTESPLFKQLVTGGEIEVRKLFCDPYKLKNMAKIIMACNDLPFSGDTSYGFKRRCLIAPFKATFDKSSRDIHIRDKLFSEASGIYNRVLSATKKFLRCEDFSDADIITAAVEDYVRDNNAMIEWIEDAIVQEDGAFLSMKESYQSYKFYHEQMGYGRVTFRDFNKEIKRQFAGHPIIRRRDGNSRLLGIENYKLVDGESTEF